MPVTATSPTDPVGADLMRTLKALKLGGLSATLPERLAMSRQQKVPHQDFLLLILSDEVSRRDSDATVLRSERACLEKGAQLEQWDDTANVTFDRTVLNELASLRFVDAHNHVAIYGPSGVGKTFMACALGHGHKFVPSLVEAQEQLTGAKLVPR